MTIPVGASKLGWMIPIPPVPNFRDWEGRRAVTGGLRIATAPGGLALCQR